MNQLLCADAYYNDVMNITSCTFCDDPATSAKRFGPYKVPLCEVHA